VSKTDKPIACTLDIGAIPSRMEFIAKLAANALIRSRREVRRLHLTFALDARADVKKLVDLERQCCAFLEFELRDGEREIELTITAPEGVEPDELLRPFQPA
jgi:hypothetical protein